ncbi:MAG: hypothetical protein AUG49_05670 [Catenulispora sp. 13_1_20CM_3_70_7]|nr:MAG: hypothetical protein AUG49_05670 [Catenulispora sp. 13_1_20CM_3_70_7]
MSLIQDLGARLQAAGADLPVGELVAALDKLRASAALLSWVRQQSADPLGVPELSGAIEHLEHAAYALHVVQDSVSGYLAAIGLGAEPAPEARPTPPEPVEPVAPGAPGSTSAAPAPRLRRWWAERVAYLTDGAPADPATTTISSDELLRSVARHTGAGDRTGLRRVLTGAPAPAGLGLSALAPALLHRLASDLLGHEPRPADLPALTGTAREPVLALLPKLPPALVDTLLAQVCRVPRPADPVPPHPADTAVTSGVLVGVLLRRLGRDPEALAA